MSVIKHEIHLLKNSLEKAIQPDSILQTESEVWDILQALKKLPMTVELLRETMIGKTVHEAKKKYTSENRLFDESRMIVALWKKDCNIPKIEKTKDEASKEPRSRSDEDAADDGQQSKTSQSKPTKAKEEPAASPLIGFRQYSILKPIPERNDVGELVFLDYPNFRPNLTPKEILQMGSFGGTYFRPITSAVTRLSYKDVWKELPTDWLVGLKINTQVASSTYSKSVNKYNETCGGDLEMWESSGWITSIDPYGWFMWYCRFYQGRRCSDDERQIGRGNGVIGPSGRWRRNLANKVLASGLPLAQGCEKHSISPKIRQLLQHWGYKLTIADLEAARKK